MPTTSPDNIYYADGSTAMSAEAISAAEATSVQEALDSLVNDTRQIQTFRWADAAARAAQTGMVAGDRGYQSDTAMPYVYIGSSWIPDPIAGRAVVVPTSVSGTGVSFDPSTGLVTFTASSNININGCFTSAYANYEIVWDIPTTSTNLNFTGRLRASGTDAATAYHRLVIGGTGAAATPTTANNIAATSWQFAAATSAMHASTLTLLRPAVAVDTMGNLSGSAFTNPPTAAGTFAIQQVSLYHDTATAYDGFSLTTSTGTMTGTLKIYGYN